MFPPNLRAVLVAALFLLILLGLSNGCDMRGCICHEALTIRQNSQQGEAVKSLQLGHEQTGDRAHIDMTIPANMNASLCLC